MSTTVLEALLNAQHNFQNLGRMGACHPSYTIGMDQLDNAITALENDMSPNDVIQDSMFDEVKLREVPMGD